MQYVKYRLKCENWDVAKWKQGRKKDNDETFGNKFLEYLLKW